MKHTFPFKTDTWFNPAFHPSTQHKWWHKFFMQDTCTMYLHTHKDGSIMDGYSQKCKICGTRKEIWFIRPKEEGCSA